MVKTKKMLRKRIAAVISAVLTVGALYVPSSFALDSGYQSAEEVSGTKYDYITTSGDIKWYKFTLTSAQVPTYYDISLQNPEDCIFEFDLRFNPAGATGRPSIVSNETTVNVTGVHRFAGVATQPGTYYIKVYSSNGVTYSADRYRLVVRYNKNTTNMLNLSVNQNSVAMSDWSICAELVGKNVFNSHFKNHVNSRTYKNAYTFVTSEHTSDSEGSYADEIKATPEETAVAADYIYSGGLMLTPRFQVEENMIYDIEDLLKYIVQYNQPIIFYLENAALVELGADAYKRYVTLKSVNVGENTITYISPQGATEVTVDYDDFLLNGITVGGINVTYAGTNIVKSIYKEFHQPAFN